MSDAQIVELLKRVDRLDKAITQLSEKIDHINIVVNLQLNDKLEYII
mgnify:CR=1 FL=1